jgi:hypothetical protein
MVIICLTSGQWKMVEPHLPKEGMCTPLTEDKAFPRLDCREIPDEATYGILRKQGLEAGRDHTRYVRLLPRFSPKFLGIAKTYCPELVQEIEKHKRIS